MTRSSSHDALPSKLRRFMSFSGAGKKSSNAMKINAGGVEKVSKTTQDASQERLRLQAVDAYRKRKGWTSRLGVQLPSPVST